MHYNPGNSLHWLSDIRIPFRTYRSHVWLSHGEHRKKQSSSGKTLLWTPGLSFFLYYARQEESRFHKLIKADTIFCLPSAHFSEVCKCTAILDPILIYCLFIYDDVLFTHLTTVVLHCAETHIEKHGLVKGRHHWDGYLSVGHENS